MSRHALLAFVFLILGCDASSADAPCPDNPSIVQDFVAQIGIDQVIRIENIDCSGGDRFQFEYKTVANSEIQAQYESAFEDTNGTSYWQKLFLRISNAYDFPLSKISGSGPGTYYCRSSTITFHIDHGVERTESGCMAAVFLMGFESPFREKTVSSDLAYDRAVKPNMRALFEQMNSYFTQHNATVSLIESTETSFYLSALGMQNTILVGLNVWEKLAVLAVAMKSDDDKWSVVFSFDGYFTGGGAMAPGSAAFRENMDPTYLKQLDEFSRSLATAALEKIAKEQ